jgi:ribonuclease D
MSGAREIRLLDEQRTVVELADLVSQASLVAIDTEFVREKTYYPKLCLIQIATDRVAASIDCLAELDLEPLLGPLFAAERTWVLHSARQDLEVVWQKTGRMPPALIDTQIAAGLAGFAPQLGLEDLLSETLGVRLGASYARTDWSRRPLPEAALDYALEDVRHLLPAWRQLRGTLLELGRLPWLDEDSQRLLAEQPVADATTIWSRLRGVYGLSFAQQTAALALVRWRESAAQRADRPRRWIMADDILLRVAASMPSNRHALRAVAEVTTRLVERYGDEILASLARRDGDLEAIVRERCAPQRPDKLRLKKLQADVKQHAAALGIEAEILATRRDLAALAGGSALEDVLGGWRAIELGKALAATPASRV